jgi:hypothetical protein
MAQRTPPNGLCQRGLKPTRRWDTFIEKIFDRASWLPSLSLSMNPFRFSLSTLLATLLAAPAALAQEPATATTEPVGFVTVGITAGTGLAKRNTLFSLPLLETETIAGQVAGTITGVTANTISNSNAGWTAGELSNPASPYLIQITSGAAEGRMFLISSSANTAGAISGVANTATTVTVSSVDAAQVDLTTLGIVNGTDTYKIFACDTLSSFFGTPESTGVQGGAAFASADSVVAVVNGSSQTYFFKSDAVPPRWSRVGLGSPDASNTPLIPYYGIQYSRLANTALSFVVTGGVPIIERKVGVKNSGPTFLAQFWPADSTLSSVGLQNLAGWLSGATAAAADTVVLTSGGSANTYFYDGSNWRRVALGSPLANDTVIPIGTTISINKRGSAAGYTTLTQIPPYSL